MVFPDGGLRQPKQRNPAFTFERPDGLDAHQCDTPVGRYVERGWVERYINQKDRRQIVLKLTPSGETFIHEVWPQIARQSGQAWEDFTKEDYDTLQHLLGKLLNRLGN